MRLIRISEAARMLGVDAETLRRRAKRSDRLEIYGHSLRVYRQDIRGNAERKFDADEIRRLLARLERS